MKKIEVVAAIIQHNNLTLSVQRGPAKYSYISHKWEFPGGKVEPNESLQDAIKRELVEELAITIEDPRLLITVEHAYPDFEIIMHCFLCEYGSLELELKEHINLRWLTKEALMSVDWAAADIPAVKALMDCKGEVKI